MRVAREEFFSVV